MISQLRYKSQLVVRKGFDRMEKRTIKQRLSVRNYVVPLTIFTTSREKLVNLRSNAFAIEA